MLTSCSWIHNLDLDITFQMTSYHFFFVSSTFNGVMVVTLSHCVQHMHINMYSYLIHYYNGESFSLSLISLSTGSTHSNLCLLLNSQSSCPTPGCQVNTTMIASVLVPPNQTLLSKVSKQALTFLCAGQMCMYWVWVCVCVYVCVCVFRGFRHKSLCSAHSTTVPDWKLVRI